MENVLKIDAAGGWMDIDAEAVKFYDAKGRLCWYFNGDGLIRIPQESPLHGNADFRRAVALGLPIKFELGEGHK